MKIPCIYIALLLLLPVSCNKGKTARVISKTNDPTFIKETERAESDTASKAKNDISYISGLDYDPPTEEKLKKWKKKVLEEADGYSYDKLMMIYFNINDNKKNGIPIKYIEAMINKGSPTQRIRYKVDYFDYVYRSEIPNKRQLMKKAIKYMKEAAKCETTYDINILNAKINLSKVYREGIYVKRDTVIADYLYDNSDKITDLDSIIKVRNYKEW